MKLRAIETQDNQEVRGLIQSSLKAFGLDIPGTAYFDSQLGELTAYYEAEPAGEYWVVEDQGKIVACGGYGPFSGDDKICELQKLYVAATAQGQGLSKLLMDQILLAAKKHYRQIYLETTSKLTVANVLYQKYQFTQLTEPLAGSEHQTMDLWYIRDL